MTVAASSDAGILRSVLLFTVVQVALVALAAVVMTRLVWTDPDAVRAVTLAAWLAIGVQTVGFVIARLVARQQLLAGWGLGVLLRFATIAGWAFLIVPALGLPSIPALLSLCVFYFASTLVEPLFLNA